MKKPRIKIKYRFDGIELSGFVKEQHALHHKRIVYIPFCNVQWDKEYYMRRFYQELIGLKLSPN